jgi:hypothetical protein
VITEASIEFHRFLERHTSFDARSAAGHIKLVTDSVQASKFGEDTASIWVSFIDRKSIYYGYIHDTTYHSDAAKIGGWLSVTEQALEGLHKVRQFSTEDIVALTLCYDAVNEDLVQFRVAQTWTPGHFASAFCTIGSWEWTWVPNPQSDTADAIGQLVFGSITKEESNGS